MDERMKKKGLSCFRLFCFCLSTFLSISLSFLSPSFSLFLILPFSIFYFAVFSYCPFRLFSLGLLLTVFIPCSFSPFLLGSASPSDQAYRLTPLIPLSILRSHRCPVSSSTRRPSGKVCLFGWRLFHFFSSRGTRLCLGRDCSTPDLSFICFSSLFRLFVDLFFLLAVSFFLFFSLCMSMLPSCSPLFSNIFAFAFDFLFSSLFSSRSSPSLISAGGWMLLHTLSFCFFFETIVLLQQVTDYRGLLTQTYTLIAH